MATVALTQNVANVYAAMGGDQKAKNLADSLFANLNTKVFHANSDPVTNEWASSILGKSLQLHMNGSNSYGQDDAMWSDPMFGGTPPQSSAGFSEVMDFDVQPSTFTTLSTGGAARG